MWILKRVREKGKNRIANNDNIKENDSSVCFFSVLVVCDTINIVYRKRQTDESFS